MRMTPKARACIETRYPEAELEKVDRGWFLFRKFGRGDPDGFRCGWRVDLVQDVVDGRVHLECVAEGIREEGAAVDAAAAECRGAA